MTSYGKDIFCDKINGKDPHDVGNATSDSVLGNGNTSSKNLIINGNGELNVNYSLTAKANATQADAELSFYDAALTKKQTQITGTPIATTGTLGDCISAINDIQTKLATLGLIAAAPGGGAA